MILNDKKIKNTILVMMLLILGISGIIITFYQYQLIKNDISSDINIKDNYVHKSFDFFLEELEYDISEKTEFILSNKAVQKAFYDRDRERLYGLVEKNYQRMASKNRYLKIMTFRLFDGSTFLRVHKPSMFGDALNKKRKIILDTLETKEKQYGFEVGKLKMTYRVVTPIFYNNNFLGVVEVGIEPEYIVSKINKISKVESALLIRKQDSDIFLEKQNLKGINQYYLARGNKHFEKKIDEIDLTKKFVNINFNGTEYLIDTDVNLFNHRDEVAAKILISYDLTSYNIKLKELLIQNIYVVLFIILMMFLVLNFGLNYFLKKINHLYKNIMKKDAMIMEQSKLAEMGEMIANIAHQWRQPLSVISTGASSIKIQNELGILKDDALNENLNSMVKSTKYLSQTIDDFRNFLKGDKEKINFCLRENVNKNLELLKGNLKANSIDVIFKDDNTAQVNSYPNELTQAFINIINNAKDALVSNDVEKKYIFIELQQNENDVSLLIRDNAQGIPKNVIDKIFEPYFTTKHTSKGTGLGLYMTYKIITESMNGSIYVENLTYSYKNQTLSGAQFTISLPRTLG